MTIAIWPPEFRQRVLVEGYQSGARGSRLSTAPEVGQAKLRVRGPKIRYLNCTEFLSFNQRARFDRFWEEDIRGGVDPFLFPDPHANGALLQSDSGGSLQDESGVNLLIESWLLCQFGKDEPTWTGLGGGRFSIQLAFVVLP